MKAYNKYTLEELLVAARDLIETKGWCQKASARDARGIITPFLGPRTASFSMSGALCSLMNPVLEPWRKASEILRSVVGCAIGLWNDKHDRTKEEVLEAFDKAIAIVRGREAA